MAYGIKYRTSYKCRGNSTSTIDILKKDYVGDVTTLTADLNAFEISSNAKLFEPTIGSGAVMRVLAAALTLTELFSSDPQEFLVKAYSGSSGGNLFFQGFVSPEIYCEDYSSSSIVPIEIQINDGMQVLDYIKFKTSDDEFYVGNNTIAENLNIILGKLNITFSNIYSCYDLKINSNSNIFSNLQVKNENFINEKFETMTCREVLNSIFSALCLSVFFRGSDIYIINPIDLHTATNGKKYTLPNFVESSRNLGGYIDLSGTSVGFYSTGQNLDIIAPISEAFIKYDAYNQNEFLYDFSKIENQNTLGTFLSQNGVYWYNNGLDYKNWTNSNDNYIWQVAVKETETSQAEYFIQLFNIGTRLLTLNIPFSNVTSDSNIAIKISMDIFTITKTNENEVGTLNLWEELENGTQINAINIKYAIKIGEYYFQATNVWENLRCLNYINIKEKDVTLQKSNISDKWVNGSVTIPFSPPYGVVFFSGAIQFELDEDYKVGIANSDKISRVLVKNVKIEFVDAITGINVGNDQIETKAVLSENLIGKNSTIISQTNGSGKYGCSRGSFLNVSYNNIIGTLERGAYNYDLATLFLQSYLSQYKILRFKLNCDLDVLKYKLLTQFYLIKDQKYLNDKAFFITNFIYNDSSKSINVEMQEITSIRETII